MSGRFSSTVVKLLPRVGLILLIAIAHTRALFVLYPTGRSDFVRFLLPTLIAFCLYMVVLARRHLLSGVLDNWYDAIRSPLTVANSTLAWRG